MASSSFGMRDLEKALSNNPYLHEQFGISPGILVADETVPKARASFKDRKIYINPSLLRSPIKAIAAVVFELQNLCQASDFEALAKNRRFMTADEFVKEFEALEHRSALKTQNICKKIFSPTAYSKTGFASLDASFRRHYLLQQAKGHSRKIADRYYPNKQYAGTWNPPLQDDDERELMASLLAAKAKEEQNPDSWENWKNWVANLGDPASQAALQGRIEEIEGIDPSSDPCEPRLQTPTASSGSACELA